MWQLFKEDTEEIRDLVTEICSALYKRGYRRVPIGAMMRLFGVPNDKAQEWDNEFFALDDTFLTELQQYLARHDDTPKPPDATIH